MTAINCRLEFERLALLSEEERDRIIRLMTVGDMLAGDVQFESWAHRNQLPPDGQGWNTWLMMAGRGFGKTRAGAEWIHGLAMARPGSRIALVGASMAEARSIMVEGVSGILSVAHNRRRKVGWEPSLGRLKWSNGSEAKLFSGDSPDGLRGPEHDFAWCPADPRLYRRGKRRGATAQRPAGNRKRRRELHRRGSADRRLGRKVGTGRDHDSGGWRYVAPVDGMSALVRSNGLRAEFDGSWDIGVVRAAGVEIDGNEVLSSQSAAIASPSGGTTVDTEARAAIDEILTALRHHGLIAT